MTAYIIAIGTVTAIYVLLTLGLSLQFGFTGLINFGHVGFLALGAYTSAILSLWGLPVGVSVLAAACVAALSAVPIGLVALRLRGDFFAIVTLGFSETIRLVAVSERELTNGMQGLPGVTPLFTASLAGIRPDVLTLIVIVLTVIAAALFFRRLVSSPFGRTIRAIRDDETAVAALGKQPAGFKFQVLIASATIGGIAGAFYAHYITFVVPDQYLPLITFYIWMAMIIGGAASILGSVIGTILLMVFLEGSRFMRDLLPGISEVEMTSIRLGAVGLFLILFMIFRPTGLMGARGAK